MTDRTITREVFRLRWRTARSVARCAMMGEIEQARWMMAQWEARWGLWSDALDAAVDANPDGLGAECERDLDRWARSYAVREIEEAGELRRRGDLERARRVIGEVRWGREYHRLPLP